MRSVETHHQLKLQSEGMVVDQEDLNEYERYRQKLHEKHANGKGGGEDGNQEAGILNNDDDDLMSSSSSGGASLVGEDDDEALVGEEDSCDDDDEDELQLREQLKGNNDSLPGRRSGRRGVSTNVKSAQNSETPNGVIVGAKYSLMTCTQKTSKQGHLGSLNNNDDIYLNNGNVELKLKPPPSTVTTIEESTKIEAESEREGDKPKKLSKARKTALFKKDPLESTDGNVGPKKKKRKIQKKRLIMNIAQTKYYVVRYVGKRVYKMKLTRSDEEDWDICWQDGAVQCEQLQRMKPYQRINHFPGMYALARKNHLARNLMRMQKIFPDDYKFFPQTWLLPSEYPDYRSQFTGKKKNSKTFIVKPEASCQGRGIFLTRTLDDVNPYDHYVIQRYLHRPFLIEGLKFDLRIYVFLCGLDPLRIYVYREGLSRFATEQYVPPNHSNLENLFMHLTNYAINKNSSKFIQNKSEDDDSIGHKRSLTFIWRYLASQGHNVAQVQKDIRQTIIKTICAVQPQLAHIYKSCQPDDLENSMCFEILGFDIMLDANLKPWILEVNHSPSFSTDSPLDFKIKKNLISDTIRLLNLSLSKKQKYKKQKQIEFQKRSMKGKPRPTQEEREKVKERKNKKRDNFERKNLGEYDLIFPSQLEPFSEYQKFINAAKTTWEEFNSGTKVKKLIEAALQQQAQQLAQTSQSKDLVGIISSKENASAASETSQMSGSSKVTITKSIISKSMRQQPNQTKDPSQQTSDLGTCPFVFEYSDAILNRSKDDMDSSSKKQQIDDSLNKIQVPDLNVPLSGIHSAKDSSYSDAASLSQSQSTLLTNIVTSQSSKSSKQKYSQGRPPSGRVRIQLDPNYTEFQLQHQNQAQNNQSQGITVSRSFVSSSQMIVTNQAPLALAKRYTDMNANHQAVGKHQQLSSNPQNMLQLVKQSGSSQSQLGQTRTFIGATVTGTGLKGQNNRFSRLTDKNSGHYPSQQMISGGPNLASFHLRHDLKLPLPGGDTPQAKEKHVSQMNSSQNLQSDGQGRLIPPNSKPLSVFDHFMKNTSSSLMRGKDTPSSSQGPSIQNSAHQTLQQQAQNNIRSNVFQYDVDFNIKSINSTFQSHTGGIGSSSAQKPSTNMPTQSNGSAGLKVNQIGSASGINYQNILSSVQQQHQYQNSNGGSAEPMIKNGPGYSSMSLYGHGPISSSTGNSMQAPSQSTTAAVNTNMIMMAAPHTAMERKRTHSMNRIGSAKLTAANNNQPAAAAQSGATPQRVVSQNQYVAQQMRQSAIGAIKQGGSLAHHLIGSGGGGGGQPTAIPGSSHVSSTGVGGGMLKNQTMNQYGNNNNITSNQQQSFQGMGSSNKIPHPPSGNFMVYHHMQQQKIVQQQ